MKTIIVSFIIVLTIFTFVTPSHALWWMIYHKPAFKGKVIDAETKEPIEGAVLVVVYHKTSMGIAESHTVTINVRETLTDKNGEFYIPSYATIIQPLSWEDKATFIIFKPGYGSFPGYPQSPSGLKPMDHELFFSEDFGKEREIELWAKGGPPPKLEKIKLPFGLVELPKLKTREERLRNIPGGPTDVGAQKLPLFFKSINEERKNLGLEGEVWR